MRTLINGLVVTFVLAALPAVLAAQELTLPRQELSDAIKAANEARIQELTAELKAAQKSITGGAKGFGNNRRDAIINARKRAADIERQLADAKKATPVPALDIDKLAVGKIGRLYRLEMVAAPARSSGGLPALEIGSAAAYSASLPRAPAAYSVPVEVNVAQIIDRGAAIVRCSDKLFWLRTATAGLATGQTIKVSQPVKVVGTRAIGSATVFELAFFADAP
jgi:hypothetical protein